MAMLITGMTVSLEFKQSTYGGEAAENLYINLQARVPDDEPGVTMEEALEQSLDLHLTAYDLKSVHEFQISNDKKLNKDLKILETVLSDNAELKHKLAEVQSDLSEAKKLIDDLCSQRNESPSLSYKIKFQLPK